MSKLLAAIVAGLFSITAVSVYAADAKKEEKKEAKKEETKKDDKKK